jgi:hypothetical protein
LVFISQFRSEVDGRILAVWRCAGKSSVQIGSGVAIWKNDRGQDSTLIWYCWTFPSKRAVTSICQPQRRGFGARLVGGFHLGRGLVDRAGGEAAVARVLAALFVVAGETVTGARRASDHRAAGGGGGDKQFDKHFAVPF